MWCSSSANICVTRSSPSRSISSGAIAASCRSAMARSSRSAAMRWACISMRQIGTRGVYANPILPTSCTFSNWKELPVAWWGFNWFPYAMLMVVLVPGLLALAFGWFAFRSRVTGVYLSIITQAMTFALFKEILLQRFRLRRQQRPDRLQGPAWLFASDRCDEGRSVLGAAALR